MLLHNEWGRYVISRKFGLDYIKGPIGNANTIVVPTDSLSRDHIVEDMGEIPTVEKSLRECTFKLARTLETNVHVAADCTAHKIDPESDDADCIYNVHLFLDSPNLFSCPTGYALTHNSWGPFLAESIFGVTVTSQQVPTRYIVERHILAECRGKIPSIEQVFDGMKVEGWMCKNAKSLSDKYNKPDNIWEK